MKKILIIGNKTLNKPLRDCGFRVCSISDQKTFPHKDDIFFPLYRNLKKTQHTILAALDAFKPDLLFEFDSSRPILFYNIEKLDIPKLWYTIDTHLHYNWHKHYAALFDKVFCAQKNYAETLKKDISHVEWLPLSFKGAPMAFRPWEKRSKLISFVGTLNPELNPARCRFFDKLKKRIPELNLETGDYIPVYRDSKIVVNQSVNDDLNYRFFEAAGCGALLINDGLTHSMDDILISGEEYLVYRSGAVDECIQKIKWALDNQTDAENMAKKAFNTIHRSHMVSNRTETISQHIDTLQPGKYDDRRKKLEQYIKALSYLTMLAYPTYLINAYKNKILEIQRELNT